MSIAISQSLYTVSEPLTPPSNTGYDSQPAFQGALDWLDITFRSIPSSQDCYTLIAELEKLTNAAIDFSPTKAVFNGRMWEGSGRGITGTLLWYDSCDRSSENADTPAQLKIALPGSVMKAVDQAALAQWLIGRAAANQLDCSRIDVCMDDRDKTVELASVLAAKWSGDFFNAVHSSYQASNKRGEAVGETIYFGHQSSSRRLRVYNKTVESDGFIQGNRWEVQFKNKLATETLYQWLEAIDTSIDTAMRWVKNVILGAIDFRDRSATDPNRARCKRLSWFQSFIDILKGSPIVIRAAIVEPSLQRSVDWIIKAVAPSLYSIKAVIGRDFQDFIDGVLTDGSNRLSNVRRKIIEATDKQQLCY